jgi:hypothetical protein
MELGSRFIFQTSPVQSLSQVPVTYLLMVPLLKRFGSTSQVKTQLKLAVLTCTYLQNTKVRITTTVLFFYQVIVILTTGLVGQRSFQIMN